MVIIGILGGASIAAVAGARRTASAPDRLASAIGVSPDVFVFDVGDADPESIGTLPEVESSVSSTFLLVDPITGGPIVTSATTFASSDPVAGGLIVEGARPDASDPYAAAIDMPMAQRFGLAVGDDLRLGSYTAEQFAAQDFTSGPGGPTVTVTVEAILREPDDVTSGDPSSFDQVPYAANASVYVNETIIDEWGGDLITVNVILGVDLVDGATPADFARSVRALPGGDSVQIFNEPVVDPATRRAINAQAIGLAILGGALAVGSFLAVGQAMSRSLRRKTAADSSLRSLGMSRRQWLGLAAGRGLVIGGAGSVLALPLATWWSAWAPVGLARGLEPSPGISVDLSVMAMGVVVITLAFTALATVTGARGPGASSSRRATGRPRTTLADRAARVGGPPSLAAALGLLAEYRGAGSSIRSTFAASVLAVAAAVAASTFAASLGPVLDDPAEYGWSFDAHLGNPFAGDADELFERLDGAPGVDAVARSGSTTVQSEGVEFALIGIEPDRGVPLGVLTGGREPSLPLEVALGARTLAKLGLEIGDTVEVDAGAGLRELSVVGGALIPEIGAAGSGLGEGGVVTLETLGAVAPGAVASTAVVDLASGIGPAERRELDERAGGLVLEPVLPRALYDVHRVRHLPAALAALAVVLGVGALVNGLVDMVRSRRRDIAVLKSLGFRGRGLVSSTVWVATGLVLAAVSIGVPLGVAMGRQGWRSVAGNLGVSSDVVVPIATIVLIVLAALTVVVLAAAVPGWLAVRTPVGTTLRRE